MGGARDTSGGGGGIMEKFTCCGELSGIKMIKMDDDNWMWVYACGVCGEQYSRDIYDREGKTIRAFEGPSQ